MGKNLEGNVREGKWLIMECIDGKNLELALKSANRVYLCGDLKKPQDLKWIHDENNEIGISHYKCFTADLPHFHTKATEYNYIIKGSTKILLIDEGREILFEEGSIFVLPPMTKYASKHLPNTKIIFFKSPGGNDKHLIGIDDSLEAWRKSW